MRKRDAWARFSIFFLSPPNPFAPALQSVPALICNQRDTPTSSLLHRLQFRSLGPPLNPLFSFGPLNGREKQGRKLALPFSSFALSTCICICVCASICARVWGWLWCGYWLAQALWLTPHCPERVKWPKPLAINRNGGTGTEKKLCCCCCC